MDINLIRSLFTAVMMVLFIGIWVWAWSSKRQKAFSEAAMLPFAGEETRHSEAERQGEHHD
jgi:cytochrome c oxidase cbb3-type subunit 4